jgi:hypothetical protein
VQLNALANALIEIGIWCSLSAISRTQAICWHRNWICRKVTSLRKIWHKDPGTQTSTRRDKSISSSNAGAAAVPCDIVAC